MHISFQVIRVRPSRPPLRKRVRAHSGSGPARASPRALARAMARLCALARTATTYMYASAAMHWRCVCARAALRPWRARSTAPARACARPKAHPSGGRKPLPQPPRSICATPSSVSSHPPAPGLQGRGGSPTRPAIPGEISDPRPATFV